MTPPKRRFSIEPIEQGGDCDPLPGEFREFDPSERKALREIVLSTLEDVIDKADNAVDRHVLRTAIARVRQESA